MYYLPTFPYSRVSRFFARGFNKFNQFSHGTPWQTLDIVSFKSENLKTWHSSQKIHGFYLYQSAAMKMSKFMITNIFWSKLVAWHYRHRGSRVRKGQRGNVFRITVLIFMVFFFFTDSSMDCMARMTRWLSFYTRTAHFLADFFAIIARLTLSSKRAMWSSLLISKIFCLRSSRLQFRRNYWSTIFLTFGLALSQFFRLVSFPRGILEPERINFERDVRIHRLQAV